MKVDRFSFIIVISFVLTLYVPSVEYLIARVDDRERHWGRSGLQQDGDKFSGKPKHQSRHIVVDLAIAPEPPNLRVVGSWICAYQTICHKSSVVICHVSDGRAPYPGDL